MKQFYNRVRKLRERAEELVANRPERTFWNDFRPSADHPKRLFFHWLMDVIHTASFHSGSWDPPYFPMPTHPGDSLPLPMRLTGFAWEALKPIVWGAFEEQWRWGDSDGRFLSLLRDRSGLASQMEPYLRNSWPDHASKMWDGNGGHFNACQKRLDSLEGEAVPCGWPELPEPTTAQIHAKRLERWEKESSYWRQYPDKLKPVPTLADTERWFRENAT